MKTLIKAENIEYTALFVDNPKELLKIFLLIIQPIVINQLILAI
jgi:hypothetical protein